VVLLDMKLNGVDGLHVLRQIRETHPNLPVVLVTGYGQAMSEAVSAALEIGAYACLYKPLALDQLMQVLTDIRHWALGHVLGR
jgi:DNA-binding NtrC family response regulator